MRYINRVYSQRMKMQINIWWTFMFEALVVSHRLSSSSLVNQELVYDESVLQTTHTQLSSLFIRLFFCHRVKCWSELKATLHVIRLYINTKNDFSMSTLLENLSSSLYLFIIECFFSSKVVCRRWPELKGSSWTTGGSRTSSSCSLYWTCFSLL